MNKKPGRKLKRPTEAEFNYQYYNLNMTAKELGKYYHVKEQTIWNWALYFKKLRKGAENE